MSAPRLQRRAKAPDGKFHSDCVCVVSPPLVACGKPMVGTVEIFEGWRARLCLEHYLVWTTPALRAKDQTTMRFGVPAGAGSLALKQLAEERK